MSNEHRTISFSGASLLQIAFIVLKLCKVIDWSWWLVLLPTIIPFSIFLIFIVAIAIAKIIEK